MEEGKEHEAVRPAITELEQRRAVAQLQEVARLLENHWPQQGDDDMGGPERFAAPRLAALREVVSTLVERRVSCPQHPPELAAASLELHERMAAIFESIERLAAQACRFRDELHSSLESAGVCYATLPHHRRPMDAVAQRACLDFASRWRVRR
jgi:hypothetical protein